MWVFGPFLRYFDFTSAQRVDVWIANSKEVAGRIKKFYRKDAIVVYPPIEIPDTRYQMPVGEKDYYLLVTRVTGAKGVVEAVRAVEHGGFHLKLVGEIVGGYQMPDTRYQNIEYLGRVGDEELGKLYAEAKGFIALARDEDFGMTVVEAMAYGTPVLAYNGGGYRETVIDPARQQISESASQHVSKSVNQNRLQTGILIDGTDAESVMRGIERMEKTKWDREAIKKWAGKFGRARFEWEIREVITKTQNLITENTKL